MNRFIIKGRLTKSPEIRTTYSEKTYCLFSVAVARKYDKDKVDFVNCTAWGKTGEFIDKYFDKGQEILIEGRMESYPQEKEGSQITCWGAVVENAYFCGSKQNNTSSGQVDLPQNLNEFELISDEGDLPF